MVHSDLTSPNSDDKLWAGLSYAGSIFFAMPPIFIFAIKKGESDFIKFHSLQAILLAVSTIVCSFALSILGLIPVIGLFAGLAGLVLTLGFFGLWIFMIIQSFTGKHFKIPVLGDFIEKSLMN